MKEIPHYESCALSEFVSKALSLAIIAGETCGARLQACRVDSRVDVDGNLSLTGR